MAFIKTELKSILLMSSYPYTLGLFLNNNTSLHAGVNEFGANMSRVIRSTLLNPSESGNTHHAGFLDSCARHCQFGVHPTWMPPKVDGSTPMQAVAEWYGSFGAQGATTPAGAARVTRKQQPRLLWAQDQPYPCIHCCNTTTV